MIVRPETSDDRVAIGNVIRAAFAGKPYAAGDEAELVDVLRDAGALTVSLVAELNGAVVGQVALSPATPSDRRAGWYALGPVSVLPELQGRQIGSALVWAGLRSFTALGAEGCILTGDPQYYVRFGFALAPANLPQGEPREFFQVKLLGGQMPTGPIAFHPAFSADLKSAGG
jgi:putative acetyltransferase